MDQPRQSCRDDEAEPNADYEEIWLEVLGQILPK
jgi:hypothetical protein